MSHRVVSRLKNAAPGLGPGWGASRVRGAKAAGLRYERLVAKALPEAKHGQWFFFTDANGPGWCQPDLLLVGLASVLVLECKYTWTPAGHTQIAQLYAPVLQCALGKPVIGVQVCRVLTPDTKKFSQVCSDLGTAVTLARAGVRTTLQWLGSGALLQRTA